MPHTPLSLSSDFVIPKRLMDFKGSQKSNAQGPAPAPPVSHGKAESEGFSWLQPLALAFLTFNSAVAVYRSRREPWGIAFVVTSYLDLMLLFWCLRQFERTPEGSPKIKILKKAVWSLTTLLTTMFAYRVAATMPLPVAAAVWAMAGLTVGTGFYVFFIFKEKESSTDVPDPLKV